MDIEAGKTLTNEEVIRELLELLKKNAMKEQANDVFEICSYVDGLEKKIDSMTEELTNMQNQIKEMQEDTLVNNAKKALSEAQERLNTRREQIKSQVCDVNYYSWGSARISHILRNPFYKGAHLVCRTHQKGIRSNTYDIIPREDWEIIEDCHEAIISPEEWEQVREIIDRRPTIMKGNSCPFYNLFHGIIYCATCGKSMQVLRDYYLKKCSSKPKLVAMGAVC